MSYIVKLVKGSKSIDLMSGGYSANFTPPRTSITASYAGGTSINKYSGEQKVTERATNGSVSFEVRVTGNSTGEVDALTNQIEWMLRQAGDAGDPLYLEWRTDNNVGFEPLWGQFGANRRLQVEHGWLDRWGMHSVANLRATVTWATIYLETRPFALGKRQILGSALGGVVENTIGSIDRRSKGVIILPTTANKMTNPVFGHSTWNNGWTTGASLVSSQNTNEQFIIYGTSSAKLIRNASADWDFTQSINVGNTNTHTLSFYCKKEDGSAVTSTDVQVQYNGSGQITNYESRGNGWYLVWSAFAGVNAAATAGLEIENIGKAVYVDAFSLEETNYPVVPYYGDMLGCAWTGTAHASTSTIAASRIRVAANDETLHADAGTIRVVLSMNFANTLPAAGSDYIFSNGATSLRASFFSDDEKFYFSDNTNTISTAAQTWSAGDIIILHFVWGYGSLKIYKNGAEAATGASFTPPTRGSYLYIGSDAASAQQLEHTIMGFAVYGQGMSAAEVLADYTNVYQVAANGQMVESIPYLWTKDGDDIVDQYNDATHDNYCVVGGVPGSDAAITEMELTSSADYARDLDGGLLISRFDIGYNNYLDPTDIYKDLSGTAVADTVGGEIERNAVNTTAISFTTTGSISLTKNTIDTLAGRSFVVLFRAYDAGANLSVRLALLIAGAQIIYSDYTAFPTIANVYRNAITSGFTLPNLGWSSKGKSLNRLYVIWVQFKRRVSGSADVDLDFIQILPRPVMRLYMDDQDLVMHKMHYNSLKNIVFGEDTSGYVDDFLFMEGDPVELLPERINYLFSIVGDIKMTTIAQTVVTSTLTYTSVYITPRWSIT